MHAFAGESTLTH